MATPPSTPATFKNHILHQLDSEVLDRLRLRPVDLPIDREIEYPGNRINNLFFPEEGIASMTATFKDGFEVEIAVAGCESVLGTSSLFGTRRSLHRVYMQVAGYGYAADMDTGTREFKRCGQFHDLTLRHVQAQFIQSSQTAGRNARHSIEQRMARWLLLCSERIGNRVLPLSHEYMAAMLGVTRPSVTVIAGRLQEPNLIQYTRGKIKILDLPGLEASACECYRVVRDHLASLADIDKSYGA